MTSVDIPNKTVDAGHVGVKSGGPSIGLVLGSGAARGFAHIGVMRALQAHGIKPNDRWHLDGRAGRRLLRDRSA